MAKKYRGVTMTEHEVRRFVLHLWKLIPEKNHRKRLLAFRRNNTFTKEALSQLNEAIRGCANH